MNFAPLHMGRYSRARNLGDGSYGAVCVAYDDESGQEVAAKAFDAGRDGSMSTETIREISALRLLAAAPNIVQLLDVAFELSELSCVTAILPLYSWTVADAISSSYKGSDALCMAIGTLRAISYLHACQMVHRDIKPENVMLNDAMLPILIDFSFCKFLSMSSSPAPSSSLSSTACFNTGLLGTPTYVAPEMLEGKIYNEKVDVYGLGVMFLEAFQQKRLDTDRDKAALRIVAEMRSRLSEKYIPATLKLMLDSNPHERCSAQQALLFLLREPPPAQEAPLPQLPLLLQARKRNLEVSMVCKELGYYNPLTLDAASAYIHLIGTLEAVKPHRFLYASLVAGKLYEQEALDLHEAEDHLDMDIDFDEFVNFEEDLFKLSSCCLFINENP
jgi:serine/threonine protein kinase